MSEKTETVSFSVPESHFNGIKHRHTYTIPVEWEEIIDGSMGARYGVTVLRCSCGDEVKR